MHGRGLTRRAHRVGPADSWDTHAWFTYYGLTGLSRHADHHAEPARPFQQLRVMEEAPILSGGYVRMVDMVTGKNDEFRREATHELERRRLGPFAGRDIALTFLLAAAVAFVFKIRYLRALALMFLLSIALHWLFCVNTTVNDFLFRGS